jgi:6-pyruvoyl-tetrahydropterin synthase
MYIIQKEFTADLAHRVHNQNLDSKFTENCSKKLKCRGLHGHTVSILIALKADNLVKDMVLDYNELGWFKSDIIENLLDHKTLLCRDDPVFQKLFAPLAPYEWKEKYSVPGKDVWKFMLSENQDPAINELLGSITILSFPSTSENLAEWIYGLVDRAIKSFNERNNTKVEVESVSYMETPKSKATYRPQV